MQPPILGSNCMTKKSKGRRDVEGTVEGTSLRQSASEVCTLVGH